MKKEKVTAVLVQVERSRDGVLVGGDTPSYRLPSADYNETIQALREAGFELVDRIEDMLEDEAAKPGR